MHHFFIIKTCANNKEPFFSCQDSIRKNRQEIGVRFSGHWKREKVLNRHAQSTELDCGMKSSGSSHSNERSTISGFNWWQLHDLKQFTSRGAPKSLWHFEKRV